MRWHGMQRAPANRTASAPSIICMPQGPNLSAMLTSKAWLACRHAVAAQAAAHHSQRQRAALPP